ncbi:MAG: SpoIIE family protein phosphatase [Thiomicrospira sp.]|uniref:ATP-binding SpoIIE family protein phosphatase n=1 Tax=Thiomicrospira sp. TaxID=935 RepID=UPI0019DC8F7A|nr:SpoIIE family protein phosphatase [Thiomicrospira sp.]MBE0493605.1 SpoIIE family protein phosphatase [Thiomicrospira sp.]
MIPPFTSLQPLSNRILIADPSAEHFAFYDCILTAQGFEVLHVDRHDAILDAVQQLPPSLVIVDLAICDEKRNDLIKRIKQSCSTHSAFVPVLLASNQDEQILLQHAVAKEADGFLQFPFSDKVLMAKVQSLLRIRSLYVALKSTSDQIHQLHYTLEQEYKDAERIYEKFLRPSAQKLAGFDSYISSASIFNGDLLLAKVQSSGDVLILLGDFTGHGLSAAIGVIPVAEMFNSMVTKARSAPEIISEINTKLYNILPAHLFFGCAILQVSPAQKKAHIYNFGMPDVLMIKRAELSRFSSRNLPLGVVNSQRLDLYPQSVDLSGDEVFYMLTDGFTESRNPQGEMFGDHRVEQTLLHAGKQGIKTLIEQVGEFCADCFTEDDATIAELQTGPILNFNYIDSFSHLTKASRWNLNFRFDHVALKQMAHPMEGLVDMIMHVQPIPSHKERLFMILDELYTNALEHGLLKLDSSLKQQEDGFLRFLNERERAIEGLNTGFIDVQVIHKPLGEYEGELSIRIEDSGEGFDYTELDASPAPNQFIFSGRGVLLTRSLCSSLTYEGQGNVVTAVYHWHLRPIMEQAAG